VVVDLSRWNGPFRVERATRPSGWATCPPSGSAPAPSHRPAKTVERQIPYEPWAKRFTRRRGGERRFGRKRTQRLQKRILNSRNHFNFIIHNSYFPFGAPSWRRASCPPGGRAQAPSCRPEKPQNVKSSLNLMEIIPAETRLCSSSGATSL